MENIEIYELLGYVKISPYRTNTLKIISDDLKMPSEIAKELNVKTSQVSSALHDLKEKDLVICVNEEVRKGRLYKCTDLGKEIIKKL
ncbi:MarR family transcriptional regulator [Methanobrevibacter sp.]|uniref:winged helix-turn-helix domain-containing protein n=1 Tax=Methanobrevibacter sp. TaxID=66852 RepID=UPI0026DEBE5C|nr:MarR family transcriptional regulator [Methanobrevibacter sp.]MDO5824529.1 MarR family transcriptional regulator [Methanobrevibacter sp.]